jgi:hypothetical protein
MWDKMKMANAIKVVRNEEMGFRKASNFFGVTRSTLKNKFNSKEIDIEELTNTEFGRKPELPYILEEETVRYCQMVARNFLG